MGTVTDAFKSISGRSKPATVDSLIEQYQTDSGVTAAREHERSEGINAMRRNEIYQKANGGVTSADPEAEVDYARAQRAVKDAQRAAAMKVKPGFDQLYHQAAGALGAALEEVARQRRAVLHVQSAAAACGVVLVNLGTAEVPDDLVVSEWNIRARAAGVAV